MWPDLPDVVVDNSLDWDTQVKVKLYSLQNYCVQSFIIIIYIVQSTLIILYIAQHWGKHIVIITNNSVLQINENKIY